VRNEEAYPVKYNLKYITLKEGEQSLPTISHRAWVSANQEPLDLALTVTVPPNDCVVLHHLVTTAKDVNTVDFKISGAVTV
jgi:hypothetical protein